MNDLSFLSPSSLHNLKKYLEHEIEKRRNALEDAAKNGDEAAVRITYGNIEQLRHLIAVIGTEIRAQEKGEK